MHPPARKPRTYQEWLLAAQNMRKRVEITRAREDNHVRAQSIRHMCCCASACETHRVLLCCACSIYGPMELRCRQCVLYFHLKRLAGIRGCSTPFTAALQDNFHPLYRYHQGISTARTSVHQEQIYANSCEYFTIYTYTPSTLGP